MGREGGITVDHKGTLELNSHARVVRSVFFYTFENRKRRPLSVESRFTKICATTRGKIN